MLPTIAMQPIEPRLIADAAMAVRDDFIDDRLPADAGKRRFARRINVGHDDAVGVVESAPELAPQRLRARIAMRLKHRQHAIAPGRARGRERRANLGRMMRVIVHQEKALALVFDLETPARVVETCVATRRFSRTEFRAPWRARSRRARCSRCAGPERSGPLRPVFRRGDRRKRRDAKSCSSISVAAIIAPPRRNRRKWNADARRKSARRSDRRRNKKPCPLV